MDDPFDLERFVVAQGTSMPQIRRELEAGRKQSHWIWFVFPQLRALGRSSTALRYGIASLAEAQAYMAHPVLGPVEIWDSQLGLFVIQALDGSLCID
jgi:uncharacterized protein (DUF1810 family)